MRCTMVRGFARRLSSLPVRRAAAAVVALCVFSAVAAAQTGSITGTVTDAQGGAPVAGARITAVSGLRSSATVVSGEDGSFRITGLSAGVYVVSSARIGFEAKRVDAITVPEAGPVTVSFALTEISTTLNQIVTTVTRGARPEKILDAPASISVVNSEQITNVPAPTIADYLKTTPGLSVSTGGMMQSNIVSRGFNNAFSGGMLMMQDYRFAAVPSLRVNVPALFTSNDDDIERIEILNGPASALYGPNSANGVLHIITKSPFESQGTTVSIDGGGNAMLQANVRNAGVFGDNKWGYKISGSYFSATDWKYNDPNEPATYPVIPGSARSGQALQRDFADRKYAGEFRLDYRPDSNFDNIVNVGYSKILSGIDITTAFGAAQVHNWSYSSFQDRLRYKGFFAQAFYNANNSGNANAQDTTGTYYLRTGLPVVDKSTVMVGQVQQAFQLGKTSMVAGADYIYTHPVSDSTIFGRNEGSTDIHEEGIYLQSTIPLNPQYDLVTAIRGDQTDRLAGSQFSPRLALVYKQNANSNWRFTFSRAFNSPASFEYMLDQVSNPTIAPGFALRAIGDPSKTGWQFARSCDGTVNGGLCMHSPFVAGGPTAAVSSTAANAFPGFMSQLAAIAGSLPAATFGGTAQQAQFVALIGPGQLGPILNALQPTDANVGSSLHYGSASTPAVNAAALTDIAPLAASFNTTWELGWKGIIAKRLRVAVDLWYQNRGDIGVPIGQINPQVFMDPAKLAPYLTAAIVAGLEAAPYNEPAAMAQATANAAVPSLVKVMAGLPQGTLAFTNTKLAPDQSVIASYTNGMGSIDVRGVDFAADYQLTDTWMVGATYSNLGQNVFPEIGGAGNPLTSNSPKHRASGTGTYTNDATGWSFTGTVRYADAFPVNSGTYSSYDPNPAGGVSYAPVPANTMIDLGASYRLPIARNVTWSVYVSDLLDTRVATFAGVPEIGRLIATRVKYHF
ncbi:MAG: TonB-dependent receptor domain-containing protein [Gemmatimonadaceae bacterium]